MLCVAQITGHVSSSVDLMNAYRINDKLNSRIHISNQFINIITVAQLSTINFYNNIIICCTNMCILTLLLIFETKCWMLKYLKLTFY